MKRLLHLLLCVVAALPAHSQSTILGYECWFDQMHNARQFVSATGGTINLTNATLSDPNISFGPHELHIRLKDTFAGQTRWSSVVSRHFVNGPGGPYQIVAVRYWRSEVLQPSDIRYKYFNAPVQFLNLTTDLDLCGWSGSTPNVKFQLLDDHGQWSSVVTRPVNALLANAPNAASSISSPGPYCPGDQVTFTANHSVIAPNGTPTSFTWTVPTGNGWGAIASTGHTITVTIGSVTGIISVVANNYCGSSSATPLQVVPVQPTVLTQVTGPFAVCANSTGVIFTTQLFTGTYHWTAPFGWSFSPPNPTGNTATAVPGPNAVNGNISVYVTNACGDNSNTVSIPITVTPLPGSLTAINWPTEACTGTQVTLDITPAIDATGYEWTTPWGTATSLGTSLTILVGTADGNITVNATNGCGDGALISFPFNALQVPGMPLMVVGSDSVCGNTVEAYEVQFDANATGYQWTSPSGWTQSLNMNTASMSIAVGASDGFIEVTAQNICGISGTTIFQVTALDIPAAPGAITGPTTLCEGDTGTYFVAAVPEATEYVWSWPPSWNGGTGSSGENTIAGAIGGSVNVIAWNACGSSPASGMSVSVTPVAAIPIVTGDLDICDSAQTLLTIQNYDAANSYLWSTGGTGATETVGTGTVTVTADNLLGCGPAVPATITVTAIGLAAVPIVVGNTLICPSGETILSIQNYEATNSYVWSTGGTDSTVTVGAGSYTVTAEDSAGCGPSAPALITVTTDLDSLVSINGDQATDTGSVATIVVQGPPNIDYYVWLLPSGWAWDVSDGDTTDATAYLVAQDTGAYEVCAYGVSALGCTSDTLCWTIDIITGMVDMSTIEMPNVYPNPTRGPVTIEIPVSIGPLSVEVLDAAGKLVRTVTLSALTTPLDLSDLANGWYSLALHATDHAWRKQLMIQR